MPSPFPGMDPYLESPDWFPDLHDSLIVIMKGTLQRSLPEPYYAQSSQRVWLEYSAAARRTRRRGRPIAPKAAQAESRRRRRSPSCRQAGPWS